MNFIEIKEHTLISDRLINKELVIVDLGACLGEFTNYINDNYNLKKSVMIEANPTNFNKIDKKENFVLYNRFISNTDDVLIDFLEDPNSPYNGTNMFNYFRGIRHQIPTISLKTIMVENNIDHIDILKIDIEGEEYNFLSNLDEETASKIDQITVEFHDFLDDSLKQKSIDVVKKISDMGFDYINKSTTYLRGSNYYDVLFYKKK